MSISYDITSRNWDNTDVDVSITDDDGFNGIKDIDNDNASFSEGTLTDVVAVDDSLQLANNYALSFDGIDDYAAISNGSFLNLNTATIEIETYIDRTLNSEKLSIIADTCIYTGASKGGWVLALDDRDARNYHFRVGVQDSTSWIIDLQTELVDYFPTAKIYNIVLVFKDSDYISIFVDGTEVYTTMISTTPVSSGLDLSLGGVSDNWFLKCQMNYFRIWNTARTQTEIQNNINTELIGNETGLVAYYKMDTGTGTTLTDYAGTNDGTIYGSSWVDDYTPQGNRIAPQLDLSTIDVVDSGVISWSEILNGETIDIETSVDNQSTWQTATNGGSITNIQGADTLYVRQTLSTTNTTATPALEDIVIEVISTGHTYTIRSDGSKFVDGTQDDTADTSFIDLTTGILTLKAGNIFDELLISPKLHTAEVIQAWYNSQAPFYDNESVIGANNMMMTAEGLFGYDSDGKETIRMGTEYGNATFSGTVKAKSGLVLPVRSNPI